RRPAAALSGRGAGTPWLPARRRPASGCAPPTGGQRPGRDRPRRRRRRGRAGERRTAGRGGLARARESSSGNCREGLYRLPRRLPWNNDASVLGDMEGSMVRKKSKFLMLMAFAVLSTRSDVRATTIDREPVAAALVRRFSVP